MVSPSSPAKPSPQALSLPRLSLRWVLVIPFVVLISSSVGIVGYLSFKSGEEAVTQLANELIDQMGDRITQHLDSYLGQAQAINLTNRAAVAAGTLDLNDFNAMGNYFYRQVRLFNFAYITFGGTDGSFIGSGNGPNNALEIAEIPRANPSELFSYTVDDQGNRVRLQEVLKNPQTNQDAWYVDGVKAGKPIWSSVYAWGDLPNHISISASTPVYNPQRQLLGVLGIDVELFQLSQFLKSLNAQHIGAIFILERSGLLIASSSQESPAPILDGKAQRLSALNSQEPLIREVTQDLISRFGRLEAITQAQLLRPNLNQRLFVKVIPYRDDYGLNWLIVSVVPEAEFMSQIQANTRTTVLLCAFTLGVALLLGLLTANWITAPIAQLSQASYAMAAGAEQQPLPTQTAIAELQTLAEAFELMSAQVYQSLDRVKIALQESKEKYQTLFQTLPIGISITDANGQLIEGNPASEQILGVSAQAQTERTYDAPDWRIIRPDGSPMPAAEFASVRALQENRHIENVEMGVVQSDGRIHWISTSAAPIPLEHYGVAIAYIDITESKQNEFELKQIESELRTALSEKVTLLQEVHHRVKNNLQVICSLLRLQKNRISVPQLAAVLEDSNNRILSMALVHQNLYESKKFAQVQLNDYVQSLMQALLQSYGGRSGQIKTQIQISPTAVVPLDQAVPCGLILNELITNAFKHGFADPDRQGSLTVRLTLEAGDYLLSVANNGEPLPAEFSLEQTRRSLGLQLMLVLTEQLQGCLRVEQTRDAAEELTIFSLRFHPSAVKTDL
uniref:histidine kinase n=1 Tax=Cyanothece sp. (strain PCC 7425 / ATCC 29141) TaxID=395961 RepID=B8HWM4_CYAP4